MKSLLPILLIGTCLTACHSSSQSEMTTTQLRKKNYANYLPDLSSAGKNINGFSRTNYLKSNKNIVNHIKNGDIQVVNEGHRITLILPTDKYFIFDTAKLDDRKALQLEDITTLVKCFPNAKIHVAGFTDDVGDDQHKKNLSQQRAQAVVAYLWAHGVNERMIDAEGYGDKYDIANNQLIHGSALNRRVEIQWTIPS